MVDKENDELSQNIITKMTTTTPRYIKGIDSKTDQVNSRPLSSSNSSLIIAQATNQPQPRQHKLRQRFTVIRKLGKGTYGKVQLGINKETGQEVAIKTIKKTKIESSQDLQRVRREIQIMSSIEHPHIIHIYEVFENKGKIVLVMQYAPGGELYEYVSQSRSLNDSEARRLFRQIATAVFYCHRNKICHRDLKLENILLDEKNNAKVADFGLSNVFDSRRNLKTFCGSPLYASPEIVQGSPYLGPEVDCWSLGVLLYTLVYGAMPFDGSNFQRLVTQITEANYFEPDNKSLASPLLKRLLCPDPRKRANIIDVCNDPWVNGSLPVELADKQADKKINNKGEEEDEREDSSEMSASPQRLAWLLKVAQDMANLTPVRFDLLIALAPNENEPTTSALQPNTSTQPSSEQQLPTSYDESEEFPPSSSKRPSLVVEDGSSPSEQVKSFKKQAVTKENLPICSEQVDTTNKDLTGSVINNLETPTKLIELDVLKCPIVEATPITVNMTKSENVDDKKTTDAVLTENDKMQVDTLTTEQLDKKPEPIQTAVNQETDWKPRQEEKPLANDKDNEATNDELQTSKPKTKKIVKKKILVKKKKIGSTSIASSLAPTPSPTPTLTPTPTTTPSITPLPTPTPTHTPTSTPIPTSVPSSEFQQQTTVNQLPINNEINSKDSTDLSANISSQQRRRSSLLKQQSMNKDNGPKKLKIPNTFVQNPALDSQSSHQQVISDRRRVSVEKSSLIVSVSNKILQQAQQPFKSQQEPITMPGAMKVSETRSEFERRASVQRELYLHDMTNNFSISPPDSSQSRKSSHSDKNSASLHLSNEDEQKELLMKDHHSIHKELSKYVESLEKLKEAAEKVEEDDEAVVDKISLQDSSPEATKPNQECKTGATIHLNFKRKESTTAESNLQEISLSTKDINNNNNNNNNSSSDTLKAKAPVPITRSYKKITFRKDGVCVTETGKIFSQTADDGTIRHIERKSKVTHYPNTCNESKNQNLTRKEDKKKEEEVVINSSSSRSMHLTSLGARQSSNSQVRGYSLTQCASTNSSASSIEAFDDVFDTWTGATNMFDAPQPGFNQNLPSKFVAEPTESIFGTIRRRGRAKASTMFNQASFDQPQINNSQSRHNKVAGLSYKKRCESVEPQHAATNYSQLLADPDTIMGVNLEEFQKTNYMTSSKWMSDDTTSNFEQYSEFERQKQSNQDMDSKLMFATDPFFNDTLISNKLSRLLFSGKVPQQAQTLSYNQQRHPTSLTSSPLLGGKQSWKGSTPSLTANQDHGQQTRRNQGLWKFMRPTSNNSSTPSANDAVDNTSFSSLGTTLHKVISSDNFSASKLINQSTSSVGLPNCPSIALDKAPRQRNTVDWLPPIDKKQYSFSKSSLIDKSTLIDKLNKLHLNMDINQEENLPDQQDPGLFATTSKSPVRIESSFWDSCLTPNLSSENLDFNKQQPTSTPLYLSNENDNEEDFHSMVRSWLKNTSGVDSPTDMLKSSNRLPPPPPMRRSVSPSYSKFAQSQDQTLNKSSSSNFQFKISRTGSNQLVEERGETIIRSTIDEGQTFSCQQSTTQSTFSQIHQQIETNNNDINNNDDKDEPTSLLKQLQTRGYRTMVNQRMENHDGLSFPKTSQEAKESSTPEPAEQSLAPEVNRDEEIHKENEEKEKIDPKQQDIESQNHSANTQTDSELKATNEDVDKFDKSNTNDEQNKNDVKSEDGDDDEDIIQARRHIKTQLERMRQTELFLKTLHQDNFKFEQQRQQQMIMSSLNSAVLSSKLQKLQTTSQYAHETTENPFVNNNQKQFSSINGTFEQPSMSYSGYVASAPVISDSFEAFKHKTTRNSSSIIPDSSVMFPQEHRPRARLRFSSVGRDFGYNPNSFASQSKFSMDNQDLNNSSFFSTTQVSSDLTESKHSYQTSIKVDNSSLQLSSYNRDNIYTSPKQQICRRSSMTRNFGSSSLLATTDEPPNYQTTNSDYGFSVMMSPRKRSTSLLHCRKNSVPSIETITSAKKTSKIVTPVVNDADIEKEMEAYRPGIYMPRVGVSRERQSRTLYRKCDDAKEVVSSSKTTDRVKGTNLDNEIKKKNDSDSETPSFAVSSKLSQLESRINARRQKAQQLFIELQEAGNSKPNDTKLTSRDNSPHITTRRREPSLFSMRQTELLDECNINKEDLESRIRRKSYCIRLEKNNNNPERNGNGFNNGKQSLEMWRDARRASISSSSSLRILSGKNAANFNVASEEQRTIKSQFVDLGGKKSFDQTIDEKCISNRVDLSSDTSKTNDIT